MRGHDASRVSMTCCNRATVENAAAGGQGGWQPPASRATAGIVVTCQWGKVWSESDAVDKIYRWWLMRVIFLRCSEAVDKEVYVVESLKYGAEFFF